ncbi:hypothetical protein DAEQUDRAFT_732289 [Daedalea quercina L-15889]|uniref:Uncharacterized protein n=1 Tax=Daedalea quercina L-15889 TaxID=1314783 RepID=A0A165LQW8_9APHY|nr:hypothetical protein DAEQUDRAFT_732289 [Daedalea quercina L-15889]
MQITSNTTDIEHLKLRGRDVQGEAVSSATFRPASLKCRSQSLHSGVCKYTSFVVPSATREESHSVRFYVRQPPDYLEGFRTLLEDPNSGKHALAVIKAQRYVRPFRLGSDRSPCHTVIPCTTLNTRADSFPTSSDLPAAKSTLGNPSRVRKPSAWIA